MVKAQVSLRSIKKKGFLLYYYFRYRCFISISYICFVNVRTLCMLHLFLCPNCTLSIEDTSHKSLRYIDNKTLNFIQPSGSRKNTTEKPIKYVSPFFKLHLAKTVTICPSYLTPADACCLDTS